MERSISPDSDFDAQGRAKAAGITTVWDRYEAQLPQCGFGETGLCCRHCLQGPCRIDPFGVTGPKVGICGATADTIVARGLARSIAGGTASHSAHAKHLAHTLLKCSRGEAPDYGIKDQGQVLRRARPRGHRPRRQERSSNWRANWPSSRWKNSPSAKSRPSGSRRRSRRAAWRNSRQFGLIPQGLDSTVAEVMHRTTNGVDADPVNILLGAIKCAMSDYTGMYLATDLSDILFGTPAPVMARANLGVLKANAVNVAVHGHNPVLSEIIVAEAMGMKAEAQAAGAPDGINLVGICCTGHEVMMRHGIPSATNSLSQELAIVTGALDAAVVDYQCVMPSLPRSGQEVSHRHHHHDVHRQDAGRDAHRV